MALTASLKGVLARSYSDTNSLRQLRRFPVSGQRTSIVRQRVLRTPANAISQRGRKGGTMGNLSTLMVLLVVWGGFTVILVGLVIFRAVAGIHEENQLFLGNPVAALKNEQVETMKRIKSLDLFIKGFGIVSGALLLLIAALWIYQGIYGAAPG